MFWFNGRTVYLMKGVYKMALKKYIGLRYAPKFVGAWDKTSEYAALSVVYTNEQSYVSRKTVPANTEITNTEFWIKSADWNAQVAQYNQNVERYEKEVLNYSNTVNGLVGKTVYTYNTKDDMVADKRVQLNDTLMTCGYAEVNDKKGSFYKAVATTSAKAIALQNNLYAIPFELEESTKYYATPEMYGAVGDGITDDSAAIASAIAENKVLYFNPKTYLISADAHLTLDNITMFGNGATIKLKPNDKTGYSMFKISGDNVYIANFTLIGDKNEHTGTTGEFGNCLDISGSNILVQNCVLSFGWGDGAEIYNNANNVHFINTVFDNNRRNGCSIVSGTNCVFEGCTFSNTAGAIPQSGVDIESYPENTAIDNIHFNNCNFINNKGANFENYSASGKVYLTNSFFNSTTNTSDTDLYLNSSTIISGLIVENAKPTIFSTYGGKLTIENVTVRNAGNHDYSVYNRLIGSEEDSTFTASFNNINIIDTSKSNGFKLAYVPSATAVLTLNNVRGAITETYCVGSMTATNSDAINFKSNVTLTNTIRWCNVELDGANALALNLSNAPDQRMDITNVSGTDISITGNITKTLSGYSTVHLLWKNNVMHIITN